MLSYLLSEERAQLEQHLNGGNRWRKGHARLYDCSHRDRYFDILCYTEWTHTRNAKGT